jgi:hypothetical protein
MTLRDGDENESKRVGRGRKGRGAVKKRTKILKQHRLYTSMGVYGQLYSEGTAVNLPLVASPDVVVIIS